MGGRGSSSKIVNRLPNHKNAVISRNKLKNYILNPTKDPAKSKFFNSLGYNMKNYQRLESDIRDGLSKNKAQEYSTNKYGHKAYSVTMELGIGKKKQTVTGWQIDEGDNKPRFITARPVREKGK